MKTNTRQALIDSIAAMREEDALDTARRMLENGVDTRDVLDACRDGMELIGQQFEAGKAFVPELIMAGEIMRQISDMLKDNIQRREQAEPLGRVLIGTVEGDIHDIGKDIVVFMLDVNGFHVIDLGVDVPVETFVDKIREIAPDVVAMSGLLTLSFDSMKATIEAISLAGLRESVKIMIGGAPVDEQVKTYTGADAWGRDAVEAVSLTKQWLGVN